MKRDFSCVKRAADTFVVWANNKFNEIDENKLKVCENLLQVGKKKNEKDHFPMTQIIFLICSKIHCVDLNCYYSIFDTVIHSISFRFSTHGQLCADF